MERPFFFAGVDFQFDWESFPRRLENTFSAPFVRHFMLNN
jgi:hypothetical protein